MFFDYKKVFFDYNFYVTHYTDLSQLSLVDAKKHFDTHGINEKRIFNKKLINFDYNFYTSYHEDLKDKTFIDACNHFIITGINKQLIFNKKLINFDYNFYTSYYEDLKHKNFIDACNHFITTGIDENRLINNNIETRNLIENLNNIEYKYDNDTINNLKFLHITKTGGTSIEEFGIKLGIKWGKYDKLFYDKFNKNGFWHIPLNYLDAESINKYNWFTIVRNPYERIISEINFLIKNEHLQFNKVDMNIYLFNIISSIHITKDNKQILNKEFIEKNDIMYAFHFLPMYFYTCNDNKIIPNIKIIKFENLNKEINSYFYGIKIDEEFNTHDNKNDKKLFEFEDLSIKNIKLINKIYKKDFELFGYKIINF